MRYVSGAREDPQRRRRRPPRDGQDLTRGGDALPVGCDQPPRHGRGGHDDDRLGRGRAPPPDVACLVARSPGVAGQEDQPDRRARRLGLPGRHDREPARSRGRARRRLRRDGRRGEHRARLVALRGARALAGRLREHARPRARRLLPHARRGSGTALGPLRRDPTTDRRRARAHRSRRPAARLRLHGSGRRA